MTDMEQPTKEVDIYRDTPVRLIGYANEVGEAFRPLIKKYWVNLSYLTASIYVVADVVDKSLKMHRATRNDTTAKEPVNSNKKVIITAADTLLWQALASVIIPGFTINRLCASSLYLLKKTTKLPKVTRKWTTTAIGLACIPLIVTPIDRLVDYGMDETVRKWVDSEKL